MWIVRTKREANLINENSEIYGPCRHRAKFHRFLDLSCTDERVKREKGSSANKKRTLKRKALRTLATGNTINTCIVIPEEDG